MLIARLPIALAGLCAWPPAMRLGAEPASVARRGGCDVAMASRQEEFMATNEFIRSIATDFKAAPRGRDRSTGGAARRIWSHSVALSVGFAAGCRLPRGTPLGAPIAAALDAAIATLVRSVVVVAIFGAITASAVRVARMALDFVACIFNDASSRQVD